MRLGILGVGMIVHDVFRMIKEFDIEYMSILGTTRSKDKTIQFAKDHGINDYYFDYDEMLASDIDTIYVALPNHLHFEYSKKALLAGKHVIIEKPITANATELKELIKIASEKKLIMVEAVNIPYLPMYKELKKQLSLIGNPKIISFNYSQYSSRYNAFKQGEILPAFDYHKAGGALMDLNVYNIHAIVGLFGKPIKVDYLANIERGIDTSGILTLDYGHFKAVCIGAKDCRAPMISTIQGDLGCLRIQTQASIMTTFEYIDNAHHIQTFTDENPKHRLTYEFKEFIDMIHNKDYEKANTMMKQSLIVSEIMQEARRIAGIVFDND